jgi:holliday junction DNA helicase RuvA
MYAYIKGKLTSKQATHVYMDVQGVGYHIHITLNTFSKIEQLDEVCLQVALIVKEDSHTLYGFFDEEEKQLFLLLLGVSGVGTNTARIILSSMSTSEVRQAIMMDQPESFNRVKGIGPKTAKQIILDLKNKIIKTPELNSELSPVINNIAIDEALSALLALGFQRQKANAALLAVRKLHPEAQSTEQLIRLALSMMT